MELEEADQDEEWGICQYSSEPIANSGCKVKWVLSRGLTLGKKMLVAGFVASSAPLVLPPLVVASAIGLAVSMPYAFFLATHTCTQNLTSKLLPRPTPLLEEVCFRPYIDIKNKEEPALNDAEAKIDNEMVGVQLQHMKNEENMTPGNDYGQGVLKEEEEKPSPQKHDNEKLGVKIYGGNGTGSHGAVTIIEGLDKIGNEIEEFKTPFGVTSTTVVLEECQDQVKESDTEESELQRETKGLLERIRDEGRIDRTGESVKGIRRGTNESDQKIGPVVENMEVAQQEDKHSSGTEGEMRNEEDTKVCEEMLQLRNDDSTDTVCSEVESGEPVRGFLESEEVDSSNDTQKPMAEPSERLDGRGFQCETIPAERIGDLLIETQVFNISEAEDSSEVTNDKTDTHKNFQEELEPLPDGLTVLQKGKLDDNSDFVNQETQLHEYNKIMDSSDADAREIADESGLHLCDEKRIDPDTYSYTIDLHEESSNVTVDGHTDSMEVLVSSVEPESRLSECSSGKNIICPSEEALFNEENIWKQIHVIRKIIGYEGTAQESCADELKALYIFTGVEPPTFLKENSFDPAEINAKLHFLMSIVGIKSNVP